MRRSVLAPLFSLAAALVLGTHARADFVVTIGSAAVAQGGTGTVDVLIRSTGTGGDKLSSFGFEFQVTPTGPRHLDFRNPQLDAQLGAVNYVFAGDSGDLVSTLPVGAVKSVSGGTNNQFIGGDDTNSGGDVTVTSDKLLVRLNLTAATSAAPIVGDSFTISLIPSAFTDFRSANNALIPFTSTPGVVRITGVPEPSAVLLFAAGAALTLSASTRFRRSDHRASP